MPVDVQGNVSLLVSFSDGRVTIHPSPLYINVAAVKYDIGGKRGIFNGVVAELLTDDEVNYLYLDNTGTFQKNTTGFPSAGIYIPLARIVCANGEIVAVYEERVLLASSASYIGTIQQRYPVDAGVRGGETSASSNNDIASIAFADAGDGWNRINDTTPLNYVSGDLTFRLVCSVASDLGANKGTRWKLEWFQRDLQEVFPDAGSWDQVDEKTFDVSNQDKDKFFVLDFTLDATQTPDFDPDKEFICFKISRLPGHADDNIGGTVHLHYQQLIYTGRTAAGEAGR